MNQTFFPLQFSLVTIRKTFVSLIGIVVPTGPYVAVIVILVVSFVAYIGLFVAETVIPAVVFAVPTFES